MRGFEPPRPEGHRHLKPARLPVPPHPQGWSGLTILLKALPAIKVFPRITKLKSVRLKKLKPLKHTGPPEVEPLLCVPGV